MCRFPGVVVHVGSDGTVTASNGQLDRHHGRAVVGLPMRELLDTTSSGDKWTSLARDGVDGSVWELVLAGDEAVSEPRRFSLLREEGDDGLWLVEHPEDPRMAEVRSGVMDVNTALVETQRELVRERSRLQRVMNELERSNQALDEFAHVVSHDLKAPLRSIGSYAAWAAEDMGPAAGAGSAAHLEQLRAQVVRMNAMIDGVLGYARAGRAGSQPERVDLGALVADIAATLSPGPAVRIGTAGDLPELVAERVPLQQVMMNLIANALAHGGPAVQVTVGADQRGPWTELSVSDDGPGVPEAQRDRIWELFSTAGGSGGTGIGLAVVKRLVEDRGGRVWVTDHAGGGASFHFTWPTSARMTT